MSLKKKLQLKLKLWENENLTPSSNAFVRKTSLYCTSQLPVNIWMFSLLCRWLFLLIFVLFSEEDVTDVTASFLQENLAFERQCHEQRGAVKKKSDKQNEVKDEEEGEDTRQKWNRMNIKETEEAPGIKRCFGPFQIYIKHLVVTSDSTHCF